VGIASLLELDLRRLLESVESKCGVKLPRRVVEVYPDEEHDILFVRFKEPRGVEVGEPLPTRAVTTPFTEEDSGKVTALEVVGLSDLLEELAL